MTGKTAAVALAVLIAAMGTVAHAGSSTVDLGGTVHSIEVETWTAGKNVAGSVLIHIAQAPDGTISTLPVTGTDDFAYDIDPVLDIDPVTDDPILVWSRNEGAGFDLYASRFAGGSWTAPVLVYADGGINRGVEIQARANLVHLFWQRDEVPSNPRRIRLSLHRDGLSPAYGPEELPLQSPNLVPPSGDDQPDSTVDATEDLSYFSSTIVPGGGSSDGQLVLYGIRDEPVPLSYHVARSMPAGVYEVDLKSTEWINHEFVMWFTNDGRFYYSIEEAGVWSEFRLIEMDQEMDELDALQMLREMLERKEQAQPE